MHGDDVASSGTQIAGEAAKGTISLIFQALMKVVENHIQERHLQQELDMKYAAENPPELHGAQKTLSDLKQGGELVSATIPKEDFEAFKKGNKDYDMAYSAFPIKDSDMVDLYFLKSDESIFKPIMDKIIADKMASPDKQYKMTMIDSDKAEAFQCYCAENNVTINMLETEDKKYKCIYRADSELKVQKAAEHIDAQKNELANVSVEIEKNGNKPQFIINDRDKDRKIRFNFGSKERFEKTLTENLGYNTEKAKLASQAVLAKMSSEQKKAFLSGSKILEKVDYLDRGIKLTDDSLLVGDFEFSSIKLKDQKEPHLLITDNNGNMAAIPQSMKDREIIEDTLRRELGISDNEQAKDMMNKIEKIGYANKAAVIKNGKYNIKRTSKYTAEIALNNKTVTVDLHDRKAAKKTLNETFGMSEKKADKILDKASKQSTTKGILNKAKSNMPDTDHMIKNKKPTRGSRK